MTARILRDGPAPGHDCAIHLPAPDGSDDLWLNTRAVIECDCTRTYILLTAADPYGGHRVWRRIPRFVARWLARRA